MRLLIADDVGIGKTIEAGLILRELLDRGEVERFAVLCPPHLVDQWVSELSDKFDIDAVAVTAVRRRALERELPPVATDLRGASLHRRQPRLHQGRSSPRRVRPRLPEFVIVDEAHTCVSTNDRTHQRYRLLEKISADANGISSF